MSFIKFLIQMMNTETQRKGEKQKENWLFVFSSLILCVSVFILIAFAM